VATALPPVVSGRLSFTHPQLQKYTDMQELLLLDPIHEVEESGWPATACGSASPARLSSPR
jgi:hypothetical protein